MKIVEKKLPIGKWRITLVHEMSGHEISSVALKGLRGRSWPIRKATSEEFFERHPRNSDGMPDDTHTSLRGMPILWMNRGTQIYLWPAPSQDWLIEITLTERAA